jgi:predicted phage gp36 major capsid-like protein
MKRPQLGEGARRGKQTSADALASISEPSSASPETPEATQEVEDRPELVVAGCRGEPPSAG